VPSQAIASCLLEGITAVNAAVFTFSEFFLSVFCLTAVYGVIRKETFPAVYDDH
jgi:hypothetical protein